MESEFDKLFAKSCVKRASTVDQELSDFRRFWEQSNEFEREEFKEFIQNYSNLMASKPNFAARIYSKLEFEEQVGEDEFHRISPTVQAIMKAIEAYEAGESYCPTSLRELY